MIIFRQKMSHYIRATPPKSSNNYTEFVRIRNFGEGEGLQTFQNLSNQWLSMVKLQYLIFLNYIPHLVEPHVLRQLTIHLTKSDHSRHKIRPFISQNQTIHVTQSDHSVHNIIPLTSQNQIIESQKQTNYIKPFNLQNLTTQHLTPPLDHSPNIIRPLFSHP